MKEIFYEMVKNATMPMMSAIWLFLTMFFVTAAAFMMNQFISIQYDIWDLVFTIISAAVCFVMFIKKQTKNMGAA